jgi:hypothetical protein
LRDSENRLILGTKVLLSVEGIDSIENSAVVKIHELDTERRELATMAPGESMVIRRDGREHRLLFHQLKGSQAVFILISP